MSFDRDSCIFCKITDGKQESTMIQQNESYCVFRDIKPAAKNHLLAVPKEHIKDAKVITLEQKYIIEDLIKIAKEALSSLEANLDDVVFGFHWPPFHSVAHLHLHAISPASEMGFFGKLIFRQNSMWFVTPEYVLSRL